MLRMCFAKLLITLAAASPLFAAATPATSLLVLDKRDTALVIVDPTSLQIVAKMPSGPDPHEVAVSSDGTTAYISNYGGTGSPYHTISVVDLINQKALPPIDLGPMHSAHGLDFAAGKLYFTAETNKVIGTYDPATKQVDWVIGTGQNRTHMVTVRAAGKQIFTSNVNSDTISIIEPNTSPNNFGPPPGGPGGPPPGGPPPGGPPQGPRIPDWQETPVKVGQGPEGFDVSPSGKELWSANSHDGSISIIDLASKKVIQNIDAKVESSNRLKFTVDGKYVFVSSLRNGELAIFDAADRKEIKRLKLGRGAAGILMRPDNQFAYVACSPDNYVAVIDLKTLSVVNKIQPGQEPDGMAWAIR
jgi:YVTN family beta-propeller protein